MVENILFRGTGGVLTIGLSTNCTIYQWKNQGAYVGYGGSGSVSTPLTLGYSKVKVLTVSGTGGGSINVNGTSQSLTVGATYDITTDDTISINVSWGAATVNDGWSHSHGASIQLFN